MSNDWARFAAEFQSRLNGNGVFLTAASGGKANTMTISWGSVGVYWGKPVITAPVRPSRHTWGMIEESGLFTISIPKPGELRKELSFCGTKSGRDVDKLAACGLEARPGRALPVPVIGQAWMHIECRVLVKADLPSARFAEGQQKGLYPKGDIHTLFMGEVVDFYET